MKLLFVGRKFDGVAGGVERMIVLLMNAMCSRGHSVSLLTWDRNGAETFYSLDSRVDWHKLDMGDAMHKASWSMRIKRMLKIRNIVRTESPDVIIAFQHGPFITVALAILGLGIPVVAAVRNSPARFDYTSSGKRRNLIYQTYRLASRITVQMDSYRSYYPEYLRKKIVHISNPVVEFENKARPGKNNIDARNILLNLGRLSYQKNQTVLLRAFAQIAAHFPQWKLRLVGDGEDYEKLSNLTNDLAIEKQVEFAGAINDISAEYSRANIFCFPSLWEGFPNALSEAMAHGLPVIGYNACEGTNELIQDGVNGILVEGGFSETKLADAMKILMQNEEKREIFGRNAQLITKKYSPELIFNQWELLLEEIKK